MGVILKIWRSGIDTKYHTFGTIAFFMKRPVGFSGRGGEGVTSKPVLANFMKVSAGKQGIRIADISGSWAKR